MTRTRRTAILLCAAALTLPAGLAVAKEIHLDCVRAGQKVMVDVDTDRLFLQLMWGDGVAEEYKNGDSYVSGESSSGHRENVTYSVSYDKDVVTFDQLRVCFLAAGNKFNCGEKRIHNSLDVAAGVLKYDDGEMTAVLKCVPAPPGRRF